MPTPARGASQLKRPKLGRHGHERPSLFSHAHGLAEKFKDKQPPGPPPPPPGWRDKLEWDCFWYLTVKKKLVPGADFEYQGQIGGGHRLRGGLAPDFVLYRTVPLALLIQGDYFHSGSTAKLMKNQRDVSAYLRRGYRVIQLWEHDLLHRFWYTMRQAVDAEVELPQPGR